MRQLDDLYMDIEAANSRVFVSFYITKTPPGYTYEHYPLSFDFTENNILWGIRQQRSHLPCTTVTRFIEAWKKQCTN